MRTNKLKSRNYFTSRHPVGRSERLQNLSIFRTVKKILLSLREMT